MSTTPDQIAQSMLATLAVTCPGLSCGLGTPERKIIDAVAQAISLAYVSNYITGSLLDIETKSGLELDQFVGIFGFGRMQGKAAEGVVTIELSSALNQNFDIQAGTQFYTKTGMSGFTTPLYFAAKDHVVLTAGTFSVDVPVKCTTVGVRGNVPPDSITYMGSMLGSSSCTNLQSMTGGVDVETDDELRHRFENTLLRNVSGTADWYKALCLQNSTVSRVEVYGPTSTYRTQIAAPGSNSTDGGPIQLSVSNDVKYTWPGMESVFIDLGKADEKFYNSPFDYEFSAGPGAPSFKRKYTGDIPAGEVVDIEFQYTTNCSRNDPVNGVTNKVDVFIDGSSPFTVAEATMVGADTLTTSASSPFYTGNFERVGASGSPTNGNRFTRLNSCPIVSFPSTISVGTSVFTMGTHYWMIRDTTKRRGSPYEISGIEWASSGPGTNTEIVLNYVYNQTPEVLTAVMSAAKQICTDVMIHQADYRYIMPCISVQYSHSYDINTVNSAIDNRLQQYFQNLPFGAWVDFSSMCLSVQQVLGVANVWVTKSKVSDPTNGDDTKYGVRVYKSSNNVTYDTNTTDFKLADNQLAQYLSVQIIRKPTP
jgi:uncharacterized phage protein gp47/JayE